MFFPDLKNTDLVAFVGKDGISVLAKALERVFAETNCSASDLSKSLHLKTRCLMAWLENVSKNAVFAQIPLTTSATDTTFSDMTISFTEEGTLLQKRSKSMHGLWQTSEIVETIKEKELPAIASRLLHLEPYQDELNETEFINSTSLNKTIQLLVDRHMDFVKNSIKLNLTKSETSATCPDCQQSISIGTVSPKLCICYKFFNNNSIHIEKNDKGGLTLHFSKKWDQENIALFSRALKNRLK